MQRVLVKEHALAVAFLTRNRPLPDTIKQRVAPLKHDVHYKHLWGAVRPRIGHDKGAVANVVGVDLLGRLGEFAQRVTAQTQCGLPLGAHNSV